MPAIMDHLADQSDQVILSAIRAVRAMGDSTASARLVERAEQVTDPELKTQFLKAALEMGDRNAIPSLIRVITGGGVFGDDAYDVLRGHVNVALGKDEPRKLVDWWERNERHVVWDAGKKMFIAREK
jgi:hypothetical protein